MVGASEQFLVNTKKSNMCVAAVDMKISRVGRWLGALERSPYIRHHISNLFILGL